MFFDFCRINHAKTIGRVGGGSSSRKCVWFYIAFRRFKTKHHPMLTTYLQFSLISILHTYIVPDWPHIPKFTHTKFQIDHITRHLHIVIGALVMDSYLEIPDGLAAPASHASHRRQRSQVVCKRTSCMVRPREPGQLRPKKRQTKKKKKEPFCKKMKILGSVQVPENKKKHVSGN